MRIFRKLLVRHPWRHKSFDTGLFTRTQLLSLGVVNLVPLSLKLSHSRIELFSRDAHMRLDACSDINRAFLGHCLRQSLLSCLENSSL